jgi:hypothetical protein
MMTQLKVTMAKNRLVVSHCDRYFTVMYSNTVLSERRFECTKSCFKKQFSTKIDSFLVGSNFYLSFISSKNRIRKATYNRSRHTLIAR